MNFLSRRRAKDVKRRYFSTFAASTPVACWRVSTLVSLFGNHISRLYHQPLIPRTDRLRFSQGTPTSLPNFTALDCEYFEDPKTPRREMRLEHCPAQPDISSSHTCERLRAAVSPHLPLHSSLPLAAVSIAVMQIGAHRPNAEKPRAGFLHAAPAALAAEATKGGP